tara:strand:+ start:269 stop:424 length:156 start_codon:yes stop_codon:yes gene_type:complete
MAVVWVCFRDVPPMKKRMALFVTLNVEMDTRVLVLYAGNKTAPPINPRNVV